MSYGDFGKRTLDLILATLMLLLILPVFIVLLVLLAIHFNGSPFFFQDRPGRSGSRFQIIKFKTMRDTRGMDPLLMSDDKRITALGQLVRKTSLDEIPQLINVIKGDMSLVGPRPLLLEYLPLYSSDQARRHDVRPGVTGWAQINGRNAISWERKFEYDVWYVDHISFALDIRILFYTLVKVCSGRGVSQQGHVTVPRFTGKESFGK